MGLQDRTGMEWAHPSTMLSAPHDAFYASSVNGLLVEWNTSIPASPWKMSMNIDVQHLRLAGTRVLLSRLEDCTGHLAYKVSKREFYPERGPAHAD